MRHCLIVLLVLLAACNRQMPAGAAAPPITVTAARPEVRDTPVYREFIGQVAATSEVEIRAKVTGLVLSQEFREGQVVEEGQVLFRLDAESLDAGVTDAKARARSAQVELDRASQDVARYRPLVEKGTLAKQTLDNAVAAEDTAREAVAAAQAQVEQAEIALKDAVIRSPYSGRIGRAQVNVGALVTSGSTVLATVSTTDTARFDFSISERDYLALVRPALEKRTAGLERAPLPSVALILADGSEYPEPGRISFGDRALSPTTGTFALSADFPNPAEVLRPGMFGRARIAVEIRSGALLIPQRAVQEVLSETFVTVVDSQNKVERRSVRMGPRVGAEWIVETGIGPEDTVVIDGHHKVRPGMTVDVIPPAAATAEG